MDTVFDQAARVLFQDQNLFPETLVYTQAGGSPKTIRARITRNPLRVQEVSGRAFAEKVIEVEFANDGTLGVTVVKEGFDQVTLARQLGDAEDTTMTVSKILNQDEMSWKVEVRP